MIMSARITFGIETTMDYNGFKSKFTFSTVQIIGVKLWANRYKKSNYSLKKLNAGSELCNGEELCYFVDGKLD